MGPELNIADGERMIREIDAILAEPPKVMERIHFPAGQEPEILTSTSEQCAAGNCEACPGIFHSDDYPGQSIFCVHSCHEKRNQDT